MNSAGGLEMIARVWSGWTIPENADEYERFVRENVLAALWEIAGYRGGYILRREGGEEVEFMVLNLFEDLEAVKGFAGEEYEVAVIEPEARALLARGEPTARHYMVTSAPRG